MFCYLNAALTVCLKGSSVLKRQGRKVVLFFNFIVHMLFFKKACACDSSKRSNPVYPLHPKQFKEFKKESKYALKKVYI